MDPADEAADAEAMAAAMGFSSFGAQKPPNKKRKYNPHADAATDGASSSNTKNAVSSTGANSAPLGTRPAPPAAATNADEISLEDDDDEADEDAPAAGNAAAAQNSLPASLPQRPAAGTGFVGSFDNSSQRGGRNQQRGGGAHPGHGGRQRNELWYEGYYDHLSNENPWARLEKKLGLQPRGTWVEREPTTQAAPA